MAGRFEGKIALVTGGSSGIGLAASLAFAREGAKVLVAARKVDRLRETVRLIEKGGGKAAFAECDVSVAAQVEAMVAKTVQTYGRLDYAFNNAGGGADSRAPALAADCTEEEWDREVNINLKGVWLCMKYEIPEMLKRGGGVIVNNSSISGLIANHPGRAAYVSAKHGVIGLTKQVALEYTAAGIRVNAVCPGPILVPWVKDRLDAHPEIAEGIAAECLMKRMGRPEEVAEAVIWLCSDAASFVVGHAIPVDGGVHIGG